MNLIYRFYTKFGIPGVLGCVDGSHFHIFQPTKAVEHLYFCRKNFHSLNVQVVSCFLLKMYLLNNYYLTANNAHNFICIGV